MNPASPDFSPDVAALWWQALQQAPTGFVLLDALGRVLQINAAGGQLLRLPGQSGIGLDLSSWVAPWVGHAADPLGLATLRAGTQALVETDLQVGDDPEAGSWVQASVSRVQHEPAAFLVQLHAIDARKQQESEQNARLADLHATSGELRRELHRQGAHDALTGLPNRAAFELQLMATWSQLRAGGARPHALLYLDLDRFQIINDTAGHDAGDALLRWVARQLRQHLPAEAGLARLGGDEFGIVLPGALDTARQWAEAWLRHLVVTPFLWRRRRYDVGASIGLASLTAATESVVAVLGQADVACYAAKTAGRNRVCVYDPEAGESLERHRELQIVSALREHLESDRCILYVQRVVALDEPQAQRFEVLVRMLDDHGDVLPPTAFIPAAEHYDLMAIVDRWVLDTCLRRLGHDIAALPSLVLHLNVSANSLNATDFLDSVVALLRASPVPPQRVVFEITETALIGHLDKAARVIHALRDLGCGVALDDFGIGLSSFNYLRTFPVDFVKIDGSFVRRMVHSSVDRRIVRSIHEVAHALGAQTIAESVESAEVLEQVRRQGIGLVQGFGLHMPEPLPQMLQRLQSQAGLRQQLDGADPA